MQTGVLSTGGSRKLFQVVGQCVCVCVCVRACVYPVSLLVNVVTGWQGDSSGWTSASRLDDPRFEPRQEHKEYYLWVFLRDRKCCADSLSVCPTPRYTHAEDAAQRSCSPCQSSVDYGNRKRPSMRYKVAMPTCIVHIHSNFETHACGALFLFCFFVVVFCFLFFNLPCTSLWGV